MIVKQGFLNMNAVFGPFLFPNRMADSVGCLGGFGNDFTIQKGRQVLQ